MTKRKIYKHIYEAFEKKGKDKKIDILFNAIEAMQSYNGRSVSDCLEIAMDFENVMDDEGEVIGVQQIENSYVGLATIPRCGECGGPIERKRKPVKKKK